MTASRDSPACRVLVVEDDPSICDVLEYALKVEGYFPQVTHRGREAIAIFGKDSADLLILDVGLPDIDGFEVCRQIRKSSDVPIIFLTSRTDEINRVVGLEIGGDDYILKPFSTRELLARVKAIRRRQFPPKTENAADVCAYGPIHIDREKFCVRYKSKTIPLTKQEFRVLDILVSKPGRVFTREQVLDLAWGEGAFVADRTIDAHIKLLRRKFGAFDFIETVRGIGYRAREL